MGRAPTPQGRNGVEMALELEGLRNSQPRNIVQSNSGTVTADLEGPKPPHIPIEASYRGRSSRLAGILTVLKASSKCSRPVSRSSGPKSSPGCEITYP